MLGPIVGGGSVAANPVPAMQQATSARASFDRNRRSIVTQPGQ
jgi:hypothetical protein